jgi:large subunit ribosomal protein L30
MLKITLTRGLVAKTDKQIKVVRALGLRKFGSTVEHADSPTIRGMLNKVHHLVRVEGGDVEHNSEHKPKKAAVKKTAAPQAKAPKAKAASAAKPVKKAEKAAK